MAIQIKVPDVGTTVEEVTLIKWRKNQGDFIKKGEIIAEIETDKAVVELESIAEGKILKILCKEGDVIKKGETIAYVGDEGEVIEIPEKIQPKISPALKALADKLGVDLSKVKGSGPDGTITRKDILEARGKLADKQGMMEETVIMPDYQKSVMKTVIASHREIPPVHFTSFIDMEKVLEFREKILRQEKIKIIFDAFFIFACSRAIKVFPEMQHYILEGTLRKRDQISIAFAVSSDRKLYLPVIRDCDRKSIMEIALQTNDIINRINEGKLLGDDVTSGCFLVSNLGMYPVEFFDAMIYPGHSGALAIGSISKKPVVVGDSIVIKNICNITLSCDHRIINGSVAVSFLKNVKDIIENGLFMEE